MAGRSEPSIPCPATSACSLRCSWRGNTPCTASPTAIGSPPIPSHQTKTCPGTGHSVVPPAPCARASSPKSLVRAAGPSLWPVVGPCPPRSSSGRSPTRHSSPTPEVITTSSRKTKNLRTKELRSNCCALKKNWATPRDIRVAMHFISETREVSRRLPRHESNLRSRRLLSVSWEGRWYLYLRGRRTARSVSSKPP